jgi:mRNA interferase MazF
MTIFNPGDVVLINFVFSDESGIKMRPAVVVSSNDYQKGRKETIIAAVTSQTDRILIGDSLIVDWKEAGLLLPSVTTGILRTVQQNMVNRKLGVLTQSDLQTIRRKLKVILNLD